MNYQQPPFCSGFNQFGFNVTKPSRETTQKGLSMAYEPENHQGPILTIYVGRGHLAEGLNLNELIVSSLASRKIMAGAAAAIDPCWLIKQVRGL